MSSKPRKGFYIEKDEHFGIFVFNETCQNLGIQAVQFIGEAPKHTTSVIMTVLVPVSKDGVSVPADIFAKECTNAINKVRLHITEKRSQAQKIEGMLQNLWTTPVQKLNE